MRAGAGDSIELSGAGSPAAGEVSAEKTPELQEEPGAEPDISANPPKAKRLKQAGLFAFLKRKTSETTPEELEAAKAARAGQRPTPGCAYLQLCSAEVAAEFSAALDGAGYRDSGGMVSRCMVEWAPCQRVPGRVPREDARVARPRARGDDLPGGRRRLRRRRAPRRQPPLLRRDRRQVQRVRGADDARRPSRRFAR